ncbi:MAG: hypothetical protein AAF958_01175 [Planctomycetota bacterium]
MKCLCEHYPLHIGGIHGVIHWARVYENGIRLAEENGADLTVVSLFAVFHDSQRLSNYADPDHGARGAALATKLRDEAYSIEDDQFELLHQACTHHTHAATHPDLTVQTCFDADRLDLGRVGITPDRRRLCTSAAKKDSILSWATKRGGEQFLPKKTLSAWNVEQLVREERIEPRKNPYTQFDHF